MVFYRQFQNFKSLIDGCEDNCMAWTQNNCMETFGVEFRS